MSRFNEDECEGSMSPGLWKANLQRTIKGRRGQKVLRELREALLALPEPKLIEGALCTGTLETIARLGEPTEPEADFASEAQRLVDHISMHQIVNAAAAQMTEAAPAAELPEPIPWFTAANRVDSARSAVVRAALRCLAADLDADANPRADSDASREYADEQLALAARDLTAAVNALPDGRPVGWDDPR